MNSALHSVVATAPGKIMLAGEYAVLHGGEAVLLAVDRRVRAWIESGREQPPSPFLAAVRDLIAEAWGPRHPAAIGAGRIIADSSALQSSRGRKLGLGSSAAVTVAATACALAQEPGLFALDGVHRIAHAAHGRAQAERGARGSGADIAAAVYGGVIAVQHGPGSAHGGAHPADAPIAVRPLCRSATDRLAYLWTGQAADTPSLVAAVQALGRAAPDRYHRLIDSIAQAAGSMIAALEPGGDPGDLVRAVSDAAIAVAELGRAAGLDLETESHRAIAELAHGHGGAAKPTGAGAGDVAVAAFADLGQKAAFCTEARARGLTVLDLSLTPTGVSVSRDQSCNADESGLFKTSR